MKIPVEDYSRPSEWVSYRVPPERSGSRLDVFLAGCLHWRSRNQIQELITGRRILRNGRRVKKSHRVAADDVIAIRVDLPEDEPRPDLIPLDFVWEDEHLFALNKEPGVVCHPVGQFQYETLVNALHHHFANQRKSSCMPQLCHRLDRETSGLLLVAKNAEVRAAVQQIWEKRRVRKSYLALAHGVVEAPRGEIDVPLAPHPDSPGGLKMRADPAGLPSRTLFRVVETFAEHTLLELELLTGRQHQIRAHLSHLGHPIVGDYLYLGSGGNCPARWRDDQQSPPGPGGLCRQALHAHALEMRHPVTQEPLRLRAPLAEDIRRAIEELRDAAS